MENHSEEYGRTRETLPLEVRVKELRGVSRAPLTLTLSPKGRWEMTFDNTG